MSELSSGEHAGGEGKSRKRRITRRPNRRDRNKGNFASLPGGAVPGGSVSQTVVSEPLDGSGVSVGTPSQNQSGVPASGADCKSGHGETRRTKRGPDAITRDSRSGNVRRDGGRGGGVRVPDSKAASERQWHGQDTGRPRGGHDRIYAALDLGTNNCRLLMAVPRAKGRFKVIDGFSRIVRLGEGLATSGKLSEKAMDRAIEALAACAAKIRNRNVKQQRLIATEACRRAENGEAFLERVKRETGLELEIVDRETEARLAAQGCGILMDQGCARAVMFDIGGGSTELVMLRGKSNRRRRVSERIEAWTSLPLGVVTLAEKFGGKQVDRELFDDMISHVCEEMSEFAGRHALDPAQAMHLLGTSGTVTTVAGLHLELPRYERRKVDGLWLESGDIDAVISRLLEMDYEARRGNPCIGAERADLVMAGCAILEAIRRTWPAERLRVADRGLREGLLTEMMEKDFAWKPRNSGSGKAFGKTVKKADRQ